MSHTCTKTDRPAFAHTESCDGPFYSVYAGLGYVAKSKTGQWLAWNMHGDFWMSYGKSREEAAEAVMSAGWRKWIRAK